MKRVGRAVPVVVVGVAVVLSLVLQAPVALAGTQDFTLVNHTGGDVYSVYVAPADSGEWSHDLLGDTIMQDEGRRDIRFSGQSACLWDILATDSDDNQVVFPGIDLCSVYKVILVCNDRECWADTE